MGVERRLAVYSDYVCPYCCLAWAGLQSLAAEGLEVALLPFELRPAPVPLPAATDPERRREWEQVIAPRAAALGLEVRFPAAVVRTRKAHELALHAARQGAGGAMHARLFQAYFAEGRDIGRIDVLLDLAAEVGLERTGVKVELGIDQYADAVAEAQRRAGTLGVRAVPAYIDEVNGFAARSHLGLLDRAELKQWLEQEQ
jgi:predicted DsbA family dithiol-disulfide isomerase